MIHVFIVSFPFLLLLLFNTENAGAASRDAMDIFSTFLRRISLRIM